MQNKTHNGRNGPTESQILFLQAALLQGQPAIQAWTAWCASADLDQLEPGLFPLLPRLYHNLHSQGITHSWLARCKGIYRRTWSQNQLYLQHLTALLQALGNASIPSLLLGESALLLTHYTDYGLRMLNQLDIATPPETAAPIDKLLQELGWRRLATEPHAPVPHLAINQTRGYQLAQNDQFVLHWHSLPQGEASQARPTLWQTALPIVVNGVETRTLSATQLLLALCTQDRPRHSIQWIPDALQLLEQTTALIDWPELLHQAAREARTHRLHDALQYLHAGWQAPIPQAVFQQLPTMPVHAFETWEVQLSRRLPNIPTRAALVWSEYQRCMWWQQQRGMLHHLTSFPQYLQARFALEHPWQLPLHLSRRYLRRFSSVKPYPSNLKGNV